MAPSTRLKRTSASFKTKNRTNPAKSKTPDSLDAEDAPIMRPCTRRASVSANNETRSKFFRKQADAVQAEGEELDSDRLDDEDSVDRSAGNSKENPKRERSGLRKASSTGKKRKARQDSEEEELDSDHLDDEDDEDFESSKNAKSPKRKRSQKGSPRKRARKNKHESESDADDDFELKEGQEVVGTVVQAPKTGRVPPGQISQNTLNFLADLKKPECNDREWFKLHEPVYRLAEKEYKDFIEEFTLLLVEADPQIPVLPPKDVIYRIYRDVRFSNDKTPYKTAFVATFSRSGRKGIFAGYHIVVKPHNESRFAAGVWCPGKNEIATIRNNIQRNPSRLRQVISAREFIKYFGEAKPHPKGGRQNIYGMDDELKNAPKGVDKNHKDIDLLKCRSFVVTHAFTDKQVLSPDWNKELAKIATVARPFIHCLNDMMTLPDVDTSDEEETDEGGDGA